MIKGKEEAYENMEVKEKQKKGISLIVLIITIIVMIILAGAIILSLSSSGIIEKANLATVKSDLSNLQEEVSVKLLERKLKGEELEGRYKLSDWGIKNSKYENRVIIENGNLLVTRIDEKDIIEKAAESLNILTKVGTTKLENTTGSNLINYRIYGNSVQDGTPTPDNPIEVESLGDLVTDESDINYGKYKIQVTVSGKNLFDKNKITQKGITTIEYDEVNYDCYFIGGYSHPPTTYTTNSNFKFDINLKKDKKYTVSLIFMGSSDSNVKGSLYMPFLDEKGNNQCFEVNGNPNIYNAFGGWSATSQPLKRVKFTITPTENIVKGALGYFHSGYGAYVLQDSIQIEEGSSVTEYEEYIEPIITNIYLDEPLRKIGDYADYIDFKNQKVVRNVKVVDDTGTLTIEESYQGLATPTEETIELPTIQTLKGTTCIAVKDGKNLEASKINVEY